MIFDNIKNIDCYKGMSEKMDKAFEYVKTLAGNGEDYREGRHNIDGDDVFAVSSEYETGSESEKRLEAHKKYIDVQFMFEGNEKIKTGNVGGISTQTEYDSDNDVYFAKCETNCELTMGKFDFAVFFPTDMHKPGIAFNGTGERVRKVVVKVSV